ncbi:MAG: hypothetical protein IH624_03805 [Phycisphaerae bacterium]|nr:hypothetical protein [Phycisphaerae bacterium]
MNDNTQRVRTVIQAMQENLLRWMEEPDRIRCVSQDIEPGISSKAIRDCIKSDLVRNQLGLASRVIAYFSGRQEYLASHLVAAIAAIDDFGEFDATQEGVSAYYLAPVLEISNVLEDCLLALPDAEHHAGPQPPTPAAEQDPPKLMKLTEFMMKYLEPHDYTGSKAGEIHRLTKAGKLKAMPAPKNCPTRKNQTKLYDVSELLEAWSQIKVYMPNLPNLRT